jgi:ribosomal-protein-alanine N-acetyltransferase
MESNAALQLRGMTVEDLAQVVVIERAVFRDPWSRKSFAEALENNPCCWVLESSGEIAAYSINLGVADEFHILNIAVADSFRRRGFAARLLEHSLHAARAQGLTDAFLEVRVSNAAAIALYEKYGFGFMLTRKRYYPDGEDAFVMHCALATALDPLTAPTTERQSPHGH